MVMKKLTSKVAGIVVDVNGAPVANTTVTINGSETGVQSTTTDASGHFEFAVVEGARHMVIWVGDVGDNVNRKKQTKIVNAGELHARLTLVSASAPQ